MYRPGVPNASLVTYRPTTQTSTSTELFVDIISYFSI